MSEELEVHNEVDAVGGEWDALAKRVGAWPFLRPGWVAAWWSAFGSGSLAIIAHRVDGRLRGVLPVVRRDSVVDTPANYHTPVFGPVAEDQHSARALANAVFDHYPTRARLVFLEHEPTFLPSLRDAATHARYRLVERVILHAPYIELEGGWDQYWASRSGKLRNSARRLRKRLEELGDVSLDIVRGREALGSCVEEALQIEASGWKGRAGTAIASEPATQGFYEKIARWGAEEGLLTLAFLRVNGRGAAMQFALEDDRAYMNVKVGFDPAFAKFGPGKLLDREMIERAFKAGLKSYEYLGSAEAYKLDWADRTHERIEFQAFAPTVRGAVARVVHTHGRALGRRAASLKRR